MLKRNRNIKVDIADPLGNIGAFRLNHMHPPFNDMKARRAVQTALSQEDYMRAVVGSDDKLWKTIPSFFTPGTPLYTRGRRRAAQGQARHRRGQEAAGRGGLQGQPVTCLVAQDQAPLKAMGEITADLLKKIGMTVDFVATDWGTVGQRRASKNPPGQGGWGMFHTWHAGADCVNPAATSPMRASGDKAWFGWPDSPRSRRRSPPGTTPSRSTRRRPSIARAQQGGDGARRLHPDRLLLRLPGLAHQSRGHRRRAAALVLGREEGVMTAPSSRASMDARGRLDARLYRPARAGDDPRHGDRRLVRLPLLYIAPGDPAAVIAGDQASPEDIERIRKSLGLDRPFLVRFARMGRCRSCSGDLGISMFTNLPVTELIGQRIEPTLSLMVVTLFLAVAVAVPLGVIAAWKAGTWIDRTVMALRRARLLGAGLRASAISWPTFSRCSSIGCRCRATRRSRGLLALAART